MTNKEAIEILSVIRHSPSVDIFNKLPNSDNIIELNYKGAFDLAIKALEERPKGEWELVSNINNDIDIVCPFCNKTRIFSYAHGYSIEEVKSQLQEVNDLPNYCENCGADMRGDNNENND